MGALIPLPQLDRGLGIPRHEYLFNRQLLGAVLLNNFGDTIEDDLQALGQVCPRQANDAAGDVLTATAFMGDDAEASFLRTWIDSQDKCHRCFP